MLPKSNTIDVLQENSHMQQILQQLQQGTQEVVKDRQDGTLEMKINPPSSLQMRAARLIIQIVNERDQVINSNQTLAKQLTQVLEENSTLTTQIKELNDRIASSPVSSTNSSPSTSNNPGTDPGRETPTSSSEAS